MSKARATSGMGSQSFYKGMRSGGGKNAQTGDYAAGAGDKGWRPDPTVENRTVKASSGRYVEGYVDYVGGRDGP